jgi:uncharacterized protein YkwD
MSIHGAGRGTLACPAVFTALLAFTPAATAAGKGVCPGAGVAPASASRAVVTRAVICEINRERSTHGLAAVRAHRQLGTMASRYARAMVRQRFFGHVSPAGASMAERIRDVGYARGYWSAGEALAWGSGARATPRAVVSAWMHSPPHRAVLLGRNYRDVGIGMALGSPGTAPAESSATYAAELGRRTG